MISWCIFDKLHVLDNTTLSIVHELIFDTLLTYESFPVQLAFTNSVDFFASVVNGQHDVIEILIGNMPIPNFNCRLIKSSFIYRRHFGCWFTFDCFQLPSFLINKILFARENNSLVRLDGVRVEDTAGQFKLITCFPLVLLCQFLLFFFLFVLLLHLFIEFMDICGCWSFAFILAFVLIFVLFVFLGGGLVVDILLGVVVVEEFFEHWPI